MSEYNICGVDLDDIHAVQLGMLDEVDRICKKHGIKYFLSGGTLLGAARHKGFIPWDDDVDLWMTRENYEIFKKILPNELSDNYFYEDYFVNINFSLAILKLEKKNTTFVEDDLQGADVGNAIYIDIFPLDNIWEPAYRIQTALLIKLASFRDYRLTAYGKSNASLIKKMLYSFIPLRLARFFSEVLIRLFNPFNTKYVNQLAHRGRYWPKFLRSDIEDLVDAEFCGKLYPVPRNIDKILTLCYGNYMKLPPAEKQLPTHHIKACSLFSSYNKM